MSSKLFLDVHPILVNQELAIRIGLNQAVVLQQIHYWIEKNRANNRNFFDGYYWTYNSFEKWQKQFPWWSLSTIKRIFADLEKRKLLVSGNYNKLKIDRTKWYRINYDNKALVDTLPSAQSSTFPLAQFDTMDKVTLTPPIPENNTEDTNRVNISNSGSKNFELLPEKEKKNYDINIIEFIKWYKEELYPAYYNQSHPYLKEEQLRYVHDRLLDFCDEHFTDVEGLQEMAKQFFDSVKNSDHNLNHFVSGDILELRYYECLY